MSVEAFVDFDGTITDLDTFDVLVRHFAGDAVLAATQQGLDEGTASIRDVLQRQASYVRAGFDEVAALLEREVQVDPSFPAFAAWCRAREIPLTVVSSGSERLIRRRLDGLALDYVPVVASGVDADPAAWRIRFRDPVPNGTDKAALVAAARDRGAATIFIGDGRSDFAAARAADHRFARRHNSLEAYLRQHNIPFDPFSSFDEITSALEALPSVSASRI